MNHLDLFTGIGGFSLAAKWAWGQAHKIVAFCEQDKFCQKMLNNHWPDVPIYEDIFKLNGNELKTKDIHLLTGGFPCQPFSVAGKQKGKGDDRYLWPEMFRVIQETKPTWIVGENVAGIINMGLDDVLSDLESEQYSCITFVIPACAINGTHRRDRIWLVAHTKPGRWRPGQQDIFKRARNMGDGFKPNCLLHGDSIGVEGESKKAPWEVDIKSSIRRKDDGVSGKLDENRIKGLGNAIVPQVAYEIMRFIKEVESNINI